MYGVIVYDRQVFLPPGFGFEMRQSSIPARVEADSLESASCDRDDDEGCLSNAGGTGLVWGFARQISFLLSYSYIFEPVRGFLTPHKNGRQA